MTIKPPTIGKQIEAPQVTEVLCLMCVPWHRTVGLRCGSTGGAGSDCPVTTNVPFVLESCSSGILCHSAFLDSPPAQQHVRPDAGWGQPGKLAGFQPEQSSSARATLGHYLERAKRAQWPPRIVDEDSSVQVRELNRAICAVTRQRRTGTGVGAGRVKLAGVSHASATEPVARRRSTSTQIK